MKFEDESNKEVEAELSQYARSGAAVESEMYAKGDRSLPTGWHDQFLDKKD